MPHIGRLGGLGSCLGADTPATSSRVGGSDEFAVRSYAEFPLDGLTVVVASDGAWLPILRAANGASYVDDMLCCSDLLGGGDAAVRSAELVTAVLDRAAAAGIVDNATAAAASVRSTTG